MVIKFVEGGEFGQRNETIDWFVFLNTQRLRSIIYIELKTETADRKLDRI